MKSLILWISFFSLSFVGFVAAFYYSRNSLMPSLKGKAEENEISLTLPDSTSTSKVDSLTLVIDELLHQLRNNISRAKELEKIVAEQKATIAHLNATNDSLRTLLKKMKQENNSIQDLTKTLSSMKIEILKPILANLSDEVVQILYQRAKTREKRKFLSAMSPKRAGKIMNKLAKGLKEHEDAS